MVSPYRGALQNFKRSTERFLTALTPVCYVILAWRNMNFAPAMHSPIVIGSDIDASVNALVAFRQIRVVVSVGQKIDIGGNAVS
jgi:hypothetical protein